MCGITITLAGSKNVKIKSCGIDNKKVQVSLAVIRSSKVQYIWGLDYRSKTVAYRVKFANEEPVDISIKVLKAFRWELMEDKKVKLYDNNEVVATSQEIASQKFVEDISENFGKCVDLLRKLEGDRRSPDEYTVEDFKKLAKIFYNYGGDVIVECWEDKDIQKAINEGNGLEDIACVIDYNHAQWVDYHVNGEGYYY